MYVCTCIINLRDRLSYFASLRLDLVFFFPRSDVLTVREYHVHTYVHTVLKGNTSLNYFVHIKTVDFSQSQCFTRATQAPIRR